MGYFTLLVLHLFAAIAFVGTVFFEVVMLEGIRKAAGRDAMRSVEIALGKHARHVMPVVILVLYVCGISMAWTYRDSLAHPLSSSFATLLTLKIILAFSVLGHFVTAVTLGARGKLRGKQVKWIHLSVFAHVIVIVFLAKAMFYITW